ncbi:MAG: right-handed parallel beta-helix repeat-containing protein, partial [Candidatus Marinimicrobia bacterium]|nr:right-handed parallel beta-helix repeat-containing protein [Candidatus Neomarinimicrobiota bacterium]
MLDGFIITRGNANLEGNVLNRGGGLFLEYSNLNVANCTFRGNRAFFLGGGIYCWQSSPRFENVTFFRNQAIAGGGMFARQSSPVLIGCKFLENTATLAAGGGYLEDDFFGVNSSTFIDCTFLWNRAPSPAGGGGAVITQNSHLTNCLFAFNSIDAINLTNGPTLTNCTIVRNLGDGIVLSSGANPTIVNSIIHGNFGLSYRGLGGILFENSNVEGGWGGIGIGNIDQDPKFVNPWAEDFRLAIGSPAINAGGNVWIPPGILYDLNGTPRIQDGIVDMGAYEGAFPGGIMMASELDLDQGQIVTLSPGGLLIDYTFDSLIIIENLTGRDNVTVEVTQNNQPQPGAGGYDALAESLKVV